MKWSIISLIMVIFMILSVVAGIIIASIYAAKIFIIMTIFIILSIAGAIIIGIIYGTKSFIRYINKKIKVKYKNR